MVCILIIDDNDLNRDMLGRRFQRRGYTVIEAPSGEAGIALTWQAHPDLILMDMRMPGMDGWAATAALKSDPRSEAIPILGLSAYTCSEDRERALALGCADYDTKPVEFARLLAKVGEVLGIDQPDPEDLLDQGRGSGNKRNRI